MPANDEPMMNHPRELPTLAEFQTALQQYRRFELTYFFGFIGGILGGLMILGMVNLLFGMSEEGRQKFISCLGAFFVGGLVWAVVRDSRYVKQHPLLLCRRCGKSLHEQNGIVIATGNCTHCGQRAIVIPEPAEVAFPIPPRMTRQAFEDAVLQKRRSLNNSSRIGMFGFLVIMFGGLGIYRALDGPNQPPPFQFLPALGFVVVIFPWLYWCRRRLMRPQPQDASLKCPNCNAALATNLVSATGKCQACHRVVFSDSLEPLAALKENPWPS